PPLMRPCRLVLRPAALRALALSPSALDAAAQTPPRPPGDIPYLINPVPSFPANPPVNSAPAAVPAAAAKVPASLDDLKQRDQELATIRAEQKKALGNEARLKREIESIGDDRRKLNQEMIDAAA